MTGPRTVLESVSARRFLVSAWPWRSAGYLATTVVVGGAAALPLLIISLPWLVLLVAIAEHDGRVLVGSAEFLAAGAVLVVGFGPVVALPLGALERRRLSIVDIRAIRSPHRRPPGPGLWPWLRTRYTEAATWRALGYAVLLVTVIPLGYLVVGSVLVLVAVFIASPVLVHGDPVSLGFSVVRTPGDTVPYVLVGLALLPAVPYLVALLAGGHAALARALLGGGSDDRLRAELVEVTRSRARLVDAFEAERRRIERDLHDGAQQRLVSLTLQLGLARLDLPAESPARQTVSDAHEQAKQLMVELRELIHGIHPQLLTDRGLTAALDELADQSAIPVTVHSGLSGRLPAYLEATAYFAVAEALGNALKHSGASSVRVTVQRPGDLLVVEVTDDGRGGADPARGSGLVGLADRVAVVDGRLLLSSPPGGPTRIRVELPCPAP
jgi:signal transduction histidine kinase